MVAAGSGSIQFQKTLLPLAVEQELGIIGMKIPAQLAALECPPPG